ncbi:hypothetical protein [Streptomyces sp. NPDC020681]|uniref:hypothetical protein n=1 Tax=Streptomyces sp. NPDC020681 TaxID=3365083 RepID=UPI0037A8F336
MTPIDELLARALLQAEPDVPHDVVPCQDAHVFSLLDADLLWPAADWLRQSPAGDSAADDLQTLCETVVEHTAATSLRDWLTEQLPEPPGARVLGCILHLTDAEDSARFWWQYAAGAGDTTAYYCLYLHHLGLGETEAAAWWREQIQLDTARTPDAVTQVLCETDLVPHPDTSTPTVLRVLRLLADRAERPRAEVVEAVMEYVPSAVAAGYVDNPDVELAPPGRDFADHISLILAACAISSSYPAPPQPATTPELPLRLPHPRRRTSV